MRAKVQGFIHDESGAILVFWAASITVLLGIVALSFDVGRMASTQSELQSFADHVAQLRFKRVCRVNGNEHQSPPFLEMDFVQAPVFQPEIGILAKPRDVHKPPVIGPNPLMVRAADCRAAAHRPG